MCTLYTHVGLKTKRLIGTYTRLRDVKNNNLLKPFVIYFDVSIIIIDYCSLSRWINSVKKKKKQTNAHISIVKRYNKQLITITIIIIMKRIRFK